ncbi:glycosyltransferase family 4 protein, partial [Patescibacteria group bacterium]
YAGRLVSWKGLDTLIDVVKDIPNAEFEIVGDGPEYRNLELRIKNAECGERIKLLGRLEHDETIRKMHQADLFVLNSAYEGLSHVILEAMACGLPVAVSRAGGNTELISQNEERGYLFEYNNKEQIKEKINHIISHPEEAQEKSKKAREFISGFSEEKMIDALETVFGKN